MLMHYNRLLASNHGPGRNFPAGKRFSRVLARTRVSECLLLAVHCAGAAAFTLAQIVMKSHQSVIAFPTLLKGGRKEVGWNGPSFQACRSCPVPLLEPKDYPPSANGLRYLVHEQDYSHVYYVHSRILAAHSCDHLKAVR